MEPVAQRSSFWVSDGVQVVNLQFAPDSETIGGLDILVVMLTVDGDGLGPVRTL